MDHDGATRLRVVTYVPRRDDIVWINFEPQAGHEQAGRRPALVLSPASYNAASGLAILCPLTSRAKHYPFEVNVAGKRVVLADQVKSVDWRSRGAEFAERIYGTADKVAAIVAALIAA